MRDPPRIDPRHPPVSLPAVDPSPEFEDLFDRLGPMTPEEQIENLLKCASAVIAPHNRAELLVLRDYLLRTLPDNPPRQTLVEIIEGQIALREIAEG